MPFCSPWGVFHDVFSEPLGRRGQKREEQSVGREGREGEIGAFLFRLGSCETAANFKKKKTLLQRVSSSLGVSFYPRGRAMTMTYPKSEKKGGMKGRKAGPKARGLGLPKREQQRERRRERGGWNWFRAAASLLLFALLAFPSLASCCSSEAVNTVQREKEKERETPLRARNGGEKSRTTHAPEEKSEESSKRKLCCRRKKNSNGKKKEEKNSLSLFTDTAP